MEQSSETQSILNGITSGPLTETKESDVNVVAPFLVVSFILIIELTTSLSLLIVMVCLSLSTPNKPSVLSQG